MDFFAGFQGRLSFWKNSIFKNFFKASEFQLFKVFFLEILFLKKISLSFKKKSMIKFLFFAFPVLLKNNSFNSEFFALTMLRSTQKDIFQNIDQ